MKLAFAFSVYKSSSFTLSDEYYGFMFRLWILF